jgi:ferritin-like protein
MADYTLRQTTPEQVTTHWSTCYTHHSACMQRKVEEMTREIQAAEKQAGHFEQLAERMGELNGHMLAEITTLREQLGIAILALDHLADGSLVRNVVTLARDALLDIREVGP